MSWSFSAVGLAPTVLEKAQKELTAIHCMEPEETVKANVLAALKAALDAYGPESVVQVEASGHQYAPEGRACNTLYVKLIPLEGFVK